MVSFGLLIVGGLNWGLVGLGQLLGGSGWNVVNMILGGIPVLEQLVYLLVGLSAVYLVVSHKQTCKYCMGSSSMGGSTM